MSIESHYAADARAVEDACFVTEVALDDWPRLSAVTIARGYRSAHVTFRMRGIPVGATELVVRDGQLGRRELGAAAARVSGDQMLVQAIRAALVGGTPLDEIAAALSRRSSERTPEVSWPHVTAAVCTRGRPDDLVACVESLLQVDYPSIDVLVIDNNDTSDETTFQLVTGRFPTVRCVREPRAGLDWARNRAIVEARGDILAFTDDDAVVDRQWLKALVLPFVLQADVVATAGLVLPLELVTRAQQLFERHGGLGRGYTRRWLRVPQGSSPARTGNVTTFGTGANMAFRRSALERLGGFDVALDAGTPSRAGGDTEMFFRVLKCGGTMVYEPAAVARHRHRRDFAQVSAQLRSWLAGVHSAFVSLIRRFPDERRVLLRFAAGVVGLYYPRRFVSSVLGSGLDPRLVISEWRGVWAGFGGYAAAQRNANALLRAFPDEPVVSDSRSTLQPARRLRPARTVTLAVDRPLPDQLEGPDDADSVDVTFTWRGIPMQVTIVAGGWPISRSRLADAIASVVGPHMAADNPFRNAGHRLLEDGLAET